MQSTAEFLTLTPTARLARAERRRLATEAAGSGATAWQTPEVLSVSAWMSKLRDDALLTGALAHLPGATERTGIIGDDGARELWREVIDTEVFVGEPRVVELAQRAWRTIHEHCLELPERWADVLLSEDSRAFQRWTREFAQACARRGVVDEWTFAAGLPGLLREQRLPLPATIRRVGFELEATPLLDAIFDALIDAGVSVEDAEAERASHLPSTLHAFADRDRELRAAARWARARLAERADQRIGIVVPDLAGRIDAVERVFAAVFDPPGFCLDDRGEAAWHVSMGPALADWPLVADALLLLGLGPNRIDQPVAGRVLRSPWLQGHRSEQRARARAEAELMRWAPYSLTLHELVYEMKQSGATRLAESLEHWRAVTLAHRDAAWPSSWTERFQTELSALGFGHGRALDSREFQVLRRWHELLESFAALDGTVGAPLLRSQALARLAERAREVTFREADPGSAVEILGVQEALGARFDAAWLTTLDRDTWPSAARRDPLIPGPLQRDVPASTADGCRLRAMDELAGLGRIAPEIEGSYSMGDDEIPRRPTPLLGADAEMTPQATASGADAASADPVELEDIGEDRRAPALADDGVRGGTAVLRDQSACPFRAQAVHRWGAGELAPPRPGLDARLRGTLLHRALEAFWDALPDRDALIALSAEQRAGRIEDAAASALDGVLERHRLTLSRAGRVLEQRCTERLLARWLDLERTRAPFEVAAREQQIAMRFGPLTLTGKIDRIDATPAGPVLIDYKTGSSGRNAWRPNAANDHRIDDPQLPAYALAMDRPPVALAFARLRPEALGFDGLAREAVGIDGVESLDRLTGVWKGVDDFDGLLAEWKQALDALARRFTDGEAAVDPREPKVCGHCHLHALCRIHERDALAETGSGEDRE